MKSYEAVHAIHRLDAAEHPEVITTDQGSYSDIVYGMFAACGYQFAPRHVDIADTQLWWIDVAMLQGGITRDHHAVNGWGAFNALPLRRVSLPAIVREWDDMVRLAGSLTTGQVRAYDLIKMMTAGGRLTGLGAAFAALRTAEAQQLQELVEDDPVADPQAMAAERMVRVVRRPIRQQSCELVPERFGQP